MKAVIYHNPRCSKSRKALELLQNNGFKVEVIEYLKAGLNPSEVELLIQKLGAESKDLVRTNEQEFKNAPFSLEEEEALISGLVKSPKVLQRPIIVAGERAFIGRPTERVEDFIQEII